MATTVAPKAPLSKKQIDELARTLAGAALETCGSQATISEEVKIIAKIHRRMTRIIKHVELARAK